MDYMLAIGVNGYGTIGKRVAEAISAQPDMRVSGVTKTRPNHEAENARARGFRVFTTDNERASTFEAAGVPVAGLVEDLVAESDLIVDATPGGVGEEYLSVYQRHSTPAIFQGKERHDMVDASFNARANFDAARGSTYVRVVSCNTTGLARALAPLEERFDIEKVRATLIRRGGDPSQSDRGPINSIMPDPRQLPSHHGPDLQTVLPQLDVNTVGITVPTTLMHVHAVNLTLAKPSERDDVLERFTDEDRIFLVPGSFDIDGTGEMAEFGRDLGRSRGDLWESCLWTDSIAVDGRDVYFFQAIHQESNVVPENIDAIRAMTGLANREESMQRTNEQLGIGLEPRSPRPRTAPAPMSE